jgi:phage protein D
MELPALSSRHGAFFAPAFVISVAGQALTQKLAIAASQVEADLVMGAAGRFSFNVIHAYDQEKRDFISGFGDRVLDHLTFGTAIEVAVGYGDHSRLTTVIAGLITEITTSFPETGTPELSVGGYDHMFPLTLGKKSRNWRDRADSDVVTLVAKEYNLKTDVVTTTGTRPQIEQNQESDYDFIKKLAIRNHYEFYVDHKKTLRFGPPQDTEGGVVTLLYGQGLLSFKPEANLAKQVSSVEVFGWDPQTKKPIVGKAQAGEESGRDAQRRSAGDRLSAAIGKAPVLEMRQPVFTEAEAKQRAKAALNDQAKQFLTGEAECIGLADLRPDRNVTLGNLGKPFSKTYYIQQTTHKVDGAGYRTRLKVKETSL